MKTEKPKARAGISGQEARNPVTAQRMADGSFVFHGRSMNPTRDKNLALEPFGCMLFQYGLKLLLLPSDMQAEMIRRTNGCARVVARDYLESRKAHYDETKGTLSVAAYKKDGLKKLKEEKPFLREVDKFALEAAAEHIDNAFENFFKRHSGYPKNPSKYKPNGNRYTTKQTNGNIRVSVSSGGIPCVRMPKVGDVRFVLPKKKTLDDLFPAGARITKATVMKDGNNYLVSLQMECVIEKYAPLRTFTPARIGAVDVGLKEFAIYGSGEGDRHHVKNERYIRLHEKRLRRLQKSLSRKKYDRKTHTGSKNYYKAMERVAREQRKTANQRRDMQHKLSRAIADAYDVFICEDLNIRGMMKNRRMSKQIASVGWGAFLDMVKYKVERNGGVFRKVSRFYASSKTCTHCNYKNTALTLKDRFWVCPKCGAFLDRDENAVDNLIKEGVRLLEKDGIVLKMSA